MKKFFTKHRELLSLFGTDAHSLGSHSTRKGAYTMVSSGSTACPSMASIVTRVGWRLAGAMDRYSYFDAAGDQFVGRTVCGLPIMSPQFASLPPHWIQVDDAVRESLAIAFPGAPETLHNVLLHCLASAVAHYEYLRELLGADHRLFRTSLFSNPDRMAQLRNNIRCGVQSDAELNLHATGVPPHVAIMHQLEEVRIGVRQVPAMVAQTVAERTAVVSMDGVAAAVRAAVSESHRDILSELLRRTAGTYTSLCVVGMFLTHKCTGSASARTAAAAAVSVTMVPMYTWTDGTKHPVPQSFALPKGTVLTAWVQYCCGDPAVQYPPLRSLLPTDMPTNAIRKRFSDFKWLMRKIEQQAERAHLMGVEMTIEEATRAYNICRGAVQVPELTEKRRKRRVGQMQWTSTVKVLRMSDDMLNAANEDVSPNEEDTEE